MITWNDVLNYLLGAGLASGCISLWFFSNLPLHVFKLLRVIDEWDEVYTWDDFQTFLCTKYTFFGELLTCPLCLGFWLSILHATILQQVNSLSYWFIPACAFSWPVFIYFFYSKFSTEEG